MSEAKCTGMTLRDYFAAKAMQSFAGTSMWGEEEDIQLAKVAYGMADAMLKARGQAQQEPVGWIDSKGNMVCTKINESCKPLYTTPQQRKWVGLTDEEINKTLKAYEQDYKWIDFARAIEAKLKEKNT